MFIYGVFFFYQVITIRVCLSVPAHGDPTADSEDFQKDSNRKSEIKKKHCEDTYCYRHKHKRVVLIKS